MDKRNTVLLGVILGAGDKTGRFAAMRELFEIAERQLFSDQAPPREEEKLTGAVSGIVCELPPHPAGLYRGYQWDPIFEQNADESFIPASVSKLMTLVSGLEFFYDLKEQIEIEQDDLLNGSGNFLKTGDVLTVEDLVRGMLLPSSNSCAQAFARAAGKKILSLQGKGPDLTSDAGACQQAFREQMKRKARLLHMRNSTFVSPSGLGKQNRSTARDLLSMLVEACSFDIILKTWGMTSCRIQIAGSNPRSVLLKSTVKKSDLGDNFVVFGGKTGYLTNLSSSLVMAAGFRG